VERISRARCAWRAIVILAVITPPLIVLRWCDDGRRRAYLAVPPAGLKIERILRISERPSLREGCGVAIYELSDPVATALTTQGVSAIAADEDNWSVTPMPDGFAKSLGNFSAALSCAGAARVDKERLIAAASAPGSFYAVWDSGGQFLLLLPPERIAAFVFNN